MNKDHMRYIRQTSLKEIGNEGQHNISNSRVLVVGAGGLGTPALTYLALAGIGTIGIVDHDTVSLSNLHRQLLFTEKDLDKNKALCAKARLKELNPLAKINAHAEQLTDENILELFKNYEIIIDGTDNFDTKYLINDACVKLETPLVFAAATSFSAQFTTFWHPHGPCYRCLYPQKPDGHVPNCAELGVLGAFTGIIGSFQALEAIKIASKSSQLSDMTGTLLTMNAADMELYSHTLQKNKNCSVCSKLSSDIILSSNVTKSAPDMALALSVLEAKKLKDITFIDVRDSSEWDAGHIEGAVHIPLNSINTAEKIGLDKSSFYITYCKTGPRSQKALRALTKLGFKNIKHLDGGFTAWLEQS
jgi:adenylyltransferase/sulfurtransferase